MTVSANVMTQNQVLSAVPLRHQSDATRALVRADSSTQCKREVPWVAGRSNFVFPLQICPSANWCRCQTPSTIWCATRPSRAATCPATWLPRFRPSSPSNSHWSQVRASLVSLGANFRQALTYSCPSFHTQLLSHKITEFTCQFN